MNPLKILVTILLLVGSTGCATYLYTAYIPAAAYSLAMGPDNNSAKPESRNPDVIVASVDTDTVQANESINNRQVFGDMRLTTASFQRLLKAKKLDNADDYLLTRVDRKDDSEFILIAAVYRSQELIEVADENFSGIKHVVSDKSPAFYEPYRKDHDGSVLDKVVAWSLVPVSCLNGSEQQAAVLNEIAGAVTDQVPQTEFWAAREQWANNGDAGALMLAGNLMSCPAPGRAQG